MEIGRLFDFNPLPSRLSKHVEPRTIMRVTRLRGRTFSRAPNHHSLFRNSLELCTPLRSRSGATFGVNRLDVIE